MGALSPLDIQTIGDSFPLVAAVFSPFFFLPLSCTLPFLYLVLSSGAPYTLRPSLCAKLVSSLQSSLVPINLLPL